MGNSLKSTKEMYLLECSRFLEKALNVLSECTGLNFKSMMEKRIQIEEAPLRVAKKILTKGHCSISFSLQGKSSCRRCMKILFHEDGQVSFIFGQDPLDTGKCFPENIGPLTIDMIKEHFNQS